MSLAICSAFALRLALDALRPSIVK